MAIMFNPQALNAFVNVNFDKDISIVNLGADKKTLVKNNELGCFLWKPFRSEENETKNNAVRTELLKALGEAFNIDGVTTVHGGKTRFSDGFMRRLEEILGPEAFKRDDFGLDGGEVASGKPLTQRRIKAIIKAACVKGDLGYDATAYSAKTDAIADAFKGRNPNALSTITAEKYVKDMKRTIGWLENDLEGFDAAIPGIDDFEEIKNFIYKKTHLFILPEEIRSFQKRTEAAKRQDLPDNEAEQNNIINIDDLVGNGEASAERRANIKTYIIDRLQTMVKESVDICLKAIAAGKADEIMEIINNGCNMVEDTLRDLQAFRRKEFGNEIPEDANEIVENNNAGKGDLDNDIEDRNSIIIVKDPPKPKVKPDEKEEIEIKDDSEKIEVNVEPKPEKIVINDEPEKIVINDEPEKIVIKDEPEEEIKIKEEPKKIEIKDDPKQVEPEEDDELEIEDELEDKKEAGGGSEVDDDSEISDGYYDDDDDDDDNRQIFLHKEARVVIKNGIKNEVNIDIDTDEKPVALDDSVIESTFYRMSDGITGRIKSLPADTQRKFKVFFYSTVRDLEAKAVSASKLADFGDMIEKLLSSINSRNEFVRCLVVELLAERKLKIFGKDDQLLPWADINAQVGNACGLIGAIEAYCTNGEGGDVAADIAHKTVMAKIAHDGKIGEAREFPAPGKEEVDELLKAAEKFDVDFTFRFPETQKSVTDILCEAMRAASRKFEKKLRKEGDSDLTAAVKKNIFKAFAVTRFIWKNASTVGYGVNKYYAGLMQDKEAGKILKFVAPAYECKTKRKLNGELVNGR